MFKRPYLLVALAVVVAAPLIANMVSRVIPVADDTASAEDAPSAEAEAAEAPPPPRLLPVPSTDEMAQPVDGNTDAVIAAAPSLDPQGIEPSADGETQSLASRFADGEREETNGDGED